MNRVVAGTTSFRQRRMGKRKSPRTDTPDRGLLLRWRESILAWFHPRAGGWIDSLTGVFRAVADPGVSELRRPRRGPATSPSAGRDPRPGARRRRCAVALGGPPTRPTEGQPSPSSRPSRIGYASAYCRRTPGPGKGDGSSGTPGGRSRPKSLGMLCFASCTGRPSVPGRFAKQMDSMRGACVDAGIARTDFREKALVVWSRG